MNYEIGEIYIFPDYEHHDILEKKNRHAVILVSQALTYGFNLLFRNCCPDCNSSCEVYSSPLYKAASSKNFLLLKQKYPFLREDRYCAFLRSTSQKTCNKKTVLKGNLKKDDILPFIQKIKQAYIERIMPRELSSNFFMGVLIREWEILASK
jgi:hypothetical protein